MSKGKSVQGPSASRGRAAHRWGWAGEGRKLLEEMTGKKWSRPAFRTLAKRIGAEERDPDGYHYRFDLVRLREWLTTQSKLTRASTPVQEIAAATGRSYPGVVLILKKEGIIYVRTYRGRTVISKADATRIVRKYRRPEVETEAGR